MSEQVIEAKKYNIDFIKETFSENYAVNSGQNFGKKWTFKNMSNEAIPRGTLKFAYEGGEYFNVQHGQPEPVLVEEVKPFSTFDVTIKFIKLSSFVVSNIVSSKNHTFCKLFKRMHLILIEVGSIVYGFFVPFILVSLVYGSFVPCILVPI